MIEKFKEKKRILLIDDDYNVTQMLKLLLESREYQVDIALSGKDAFLKATNNVDLILLDLVLPDFDGFDVCRKLKEDKKTNHIPIIILSAKYLFEDKVEGLYLGADDYLTKPFEHEELFARMEAVMRRSSDFRFSATGEEGIVIELRKIIDEERIIPFYQPIYFLNSRKMLGLEVLSRPETDGPLSNPDILFKAALKYGLYHDLEMLSWRKAIRFLSDVIDGQMVFLNCNPYLIEGPKFLMVKSIFEQNEIPTKNVILEITERSRIVNYKVFYEHLQRYREFGFRFAVDDVGGGFASLESIVETRPEVVKIDRHIVNDVDRDPFKRSIIKFIVSFCKENNIISIAEGIETKEQLDILVEIGVDAGQGYFLYKPTKDVNLKHMSDAIAVC